MSVLKVNKVQTQLTPKELDDLSKDVRMNLIDHTDKIEFIRNLISESRRTVADMPKDNEGKVIVDLENPHILEDMDYFRPCAINFEKTGEYTNIFPNTAPGSEYRKFWDEQIRRCKYGYVRESDGEWIPGEYYFYLNFCRIRRTQIIEGAERQEDGTIAAERVYAHPDVWDGDYLYFHYLNKGKMSGKHGALLKTRGRGYSFKGGSLLAYDFYFWDKSSSYAVASSEDYLIKDGLLTKAWEIMNDINGLTPWYKSFLPDKQMHRVNSYRTKDGAVKGTFSEVMGVSLKNDPEKHRGKRGRRMLFEELGKFPGVEKAWNVARDSFEEGGRVFGQMIAFGTGGSKGANFEGAVKFFYKPRGYNIYSIRNVYDKAAGKEHCSFWIGIYLNRADCYDKNGNSDVIKALLEVFKERDLLIKSGVDASTIVQRKAENAITPQEAILRTEGSQFPILDIKDALADIRSNLTEFLSPHYVGMMGIREGEIIFEQDAMLRPIHQYPIKDDTNKEGAIEVFMPPNEVKGDSVGSRYIIGIDPVRYDEVEFSVSLASAFVFDLWLDEIVAEYTCRPKSVDDFNEQVYRLAVWYNAEINFENDITDIFTYFRNKGALHYLCNTPDIVKSMEIAREGRGNRSKGTPSGVKLNAQARAWQAQWMKEKYKQAEEGEENILNVHRIRSIAYLIECEDWNRDGNFDRVSAMGMVMILRAEKLFTLDMSMSMKVYYGEDDEFFKDTFDNIYGNEDISSDDFDPGALSGHDRKLLKDLNIIDYEYK